MVGLSGSGGGGCFLQKVKEVLFSVVKNNKKKYNLVEEGRRLHGLLVVGGFLHTDSRLLGSLLVQLYADSGCLPEALLLFRTLSLSLPLPLPLPPHKEHNIACNAILRAHLDSALFSDAIHFFTHIVSNSSLAFVPDNYTCPLVFKACSQLSSLEDARKVHHLIKNFNFKPNVYTRCALIDMYAKCGSLEDARQVFDEMPDKERDLASWTAMICGSIHQGQPLQALSLFNAMRLGGLHPDSPLLAAILPACGRLQAGQTGMALQATAFKSGFHDDVFVANATIDMYCKLGDTQRAYNVFCGMPCRDHVSWRTLIAGYSYNSQYQWSLALYAEMMNSGITPSTMVAASILPVLGKLNLSEEGGAMHGFILKQGFDSDVVVGSALIDMYSLCGFTRETEILLSIWSDWDLMIWNSAISGNAACVENYGLALSIFRKMRESRFKPNSITLMTILPICTKMGAHKHGMEIHCHAIRHGLDTAVSVSNSLIDMYCKCGYLGLGLRVFDKMVERDTISYNTVISAYGFHGNAEQALLLFDEMKALAVKPSGATFVGLLCACSHAGLVDEGQALYHSMVVDYGIRPNMEHYSCMVDLLGRAGRINEACKFIRTMPEEPDANVLGCLLAACRLHNMVESVDLLDEGILQDKMDDSGYHILFTNMYASRKRWKDASRVRSLLKEKGLRKKTGKSWTQIGHRTHVFEARDTTHSEFEKVQEILTILLSDMKEQYDFDNLLHAAQ